MQNLSSHLQKRNTKRFLIEDRRMKITSLLAQSMNQTEISKELNIHISTVSRDVKYLKKQSHQFIYDLAKSDLAFYYKQCLEGIDEVKRRTWQIFKETACSKDKLFALKVIKECDEAKFELFKQGPSIMNVQVLEERLNRLESDRKETE